MNKSGCLWLFLFLLSIAILYGMIFKVDIQDAQDVTKDMQGQWVGYDHEGGQYTHYRLIIKGNTYKGWMTVESTDNEPTWNARPDEEGTWELGDVKGFTNSSSNYRNIYFTKDEGGFGNNSLLARTFTNMIIYDGGLYVAGWGPMKSKDGFFSFLSSKNDGEEDGIDNSNESQSNVDTEMEKEDTEVSNMVTLNGGCEFETKYLTKYKTGKSNIFYVFKVSDGALMALYDNNGKEESIVDVEIEGCQILTFEAGTLVGFEEIDGVKYFTYNIGGSGGSSTYYHPEYTSSKEIYSEENE